MNTRLPKPRFTDLVDIVLLEKMNSDAITSSFNQEQRARLEAHAASSYTVLLDADQDIVRKLVAEAQKGLVDLDVEISAMDAALYTLRQHRTKEIERIERLQAGVAPHKRLPPELMAAIFVLSLQDEPVEVPPCQPIPLSWTLGWVCSRWRDIAFREPLLWNRIQILTESPWSAKTVESIHHVCSHRGGAGKIELHVSSRCLDDWDALLGVISSYSSRIRDLQLTISNSFPLAAPVGTFDSLESLTIHGGVRPDSVTAFSLVPNLRKLNLFPMPWHPTMLFPWAQLTDFVITAVSPNTCLEILRECSQLLDFEVIFSPDAIGHADPLRHISLPCLRSLSITPNKIRNLAQVLDALVLPALKTISFGLGFVGGWPQENILDLLKRSGNGVESFETSDFIVPGQHVVSLMRAMPQLTEFIASTDHIIPDHAFSTMNSEGLAPKLRIFREWEASSLRTALDFLESRWLRDDHGRYEGICDASFFIEESAYDEESSKSLSESLSDLQQHGRKIAVKVF